MARIKVESEDSSRNYPRVVELTWEILKKKRDGVELTPDEKTLVSMHEAQCKEREEQGMKANEDLQKTCKLVTSGTEKDLIPAYGWIQPIKKMAFELEALNILYKKHRVKIVFDQCKEKFAEFCGYYSLEYVDSKIVNFLMWLPRLVDRKLNPRSFDYHLETATSVPTHSEEIWTDDGTLAEVKRFSYKRDYKPTKHRLVYAIYKLNDKLSTWLYRHLDVFNRVSRETEVVSEMLDNKAQEIVSKCEAECRNHCIRCGMPINHDRWSTRGWYTYICKDCASLEEGGLASTTNLTAQERAKKEIIFKHNLKKAIEDSELKDSFTQEALDSLDPKKGKSGRIKTSSGIVVDNFYEEDEEDWH